jgi:Ca2+-binding EF-hand superfamily protein
VAAAAADRSNSGRHDLRYDPDTGNPIIKDPNSRTMQDIFRKLELTGDAVDREHAALALSKLGYRLEPCEITRLLEQVDTSNSGKVKRAALAASQIDWRHLQQNHMDHWLDIAHRAFATLDHNGDGLLHVSDIMSSLKSKLPQDELRRTIQQAMQEAGHGGEQGACCRVCWSVGVGTLSRCMCHFLVVGSPLQLQHGKAVPHDVMSCSIWMRNSSYWLNHQQ